MQNFLETTVQSFLLTATTGHWMLTLSELCSLLPSVSWASLLTNVSVSSWFHQQRCLLCCLWVQWFPRGFWFLTPFLLFFPDIKSVLSEATTLIAVKICDGVLDARSSELLWPVAFRDVVISTRSFSATWPSEQDNNVPAVPRERFFTMKVCAGQRPLSWRSLLREVLGREGGGMFLFAFRVRVIKLMVFTDVRGFETILCFSDSWIRMRVRARWTWGSSVLTMFRLLPVSLSFRPGYKCHDMDVCSLFRFSYLLT